MNKRLSKSDYLLTFLILFLIIAALSSFFYGVKIGKDKTSAHYELLIAEKQEISTELIAYHQQYLVSFYHTIYLPYRDFQKKWFDRMDAVELQGNSIDVEDVMKELSKLADEKFRAIEDMSMPVTSPMLQQAHSNYLKSLKLFAEATTRFRPQVGSKSSQAILEAIRKDAYFIEAQRFGLVAQSEFYSSITRWNETLAPNLYGIELAVKSDLTFNEWSEMNLNLKNEFVSRILMEDSFYESFYPQDLTIRLDEMIVDGFASRNSISTLRPLINMIVDTNAVRDGDFLRRKEKFYKSEPLPQLPFFNE